MVYAFHDEIGNGYVTHFRDNGCQVALLDGDVMLTPICPVNFHYGSFDLFKWRDNLWKMTKDYVFYMTAIPSGKQDWIVNLNRVGVVDHDVTVKALDHVEKKDIEELPGDMVDLMDIIEAGLCEDRFEIINNMIVFFQAQKKNVSEIEVEMRCYDIHTLEMLSQYRHDFDKVPHVTFHAFGPLVLLKFDNIGLVYDSLLNQIKEIELGNFEIWTDFDTVIVQSNEPKHGYEIWHHTKKMSHLNAYDCLPDVGLSFH